MAALESKLETYEKEIKQLQKALEKSDRLIADLESRQNHQNQSQFKEKETSPQVSSLNYNPYVQQTNAILNNGANNNNNNNIKQEFQKYSNGSAPHSGKNTFKTDTSKNVKFAEKVDTVTSPPPSSSKPPTGNVISNNKFYGSPSKTPKSSSTHALNTGPRIMSFNDRMRNNMYGLGGELDSVSMNHPLGSNSFSGNTNGIGHNQVAANASQQFLFSPLKRLRLDDGLTSGDDMFNAHLESELQEQQTSNSLKSASAYITTPLNYKQPVFNNNNNFNQNGAIKHDNGGGIDSGNTVDRTTSEFIDCMELLNQAERKVQNRQISPQNDSSG
jgi:hypothetical protein